MKIYTKGGDKGRTSLIGGERVPKYDLRVEAYGTVDELTAFAALLADKLMREEIFLEIEKQLRSVESQLMTVAALLAIGEGGRDKVAGLKTQFPTNFTSASGKKYEEHKLPDGDNGNIEPITKEQFNKMGYSSRVELKQKNPEQYSQLMKG